MKETELRNLDLYKVGNLRPIFLSFGTQTFRNIPKHSNIPRLNSLTWLHLIRNKIIYI